MRLSGAASRRLREANPSTWWLLRPACPPAGFTRFALLYAYFRWADDVVDAPGRDPRRVGAFVARQDALVAAGEPLVDATFEERCLGQVLAEPELAPVARQMWAAIRFDATRGPEPLDDAVLSAQVARIGDAYLAALWTCGGGRGRPPAGLAWLSRAATAAHMLRDLDADLALGYCNIPASWLGGRGPAGLGPADLARWRRERAAELAGWFDRGEAAFGAVRPLRLRWLLLAFGRQYRRLAEAGGGPGGDA